MTHARFARHLSAFAAERTGFVIERRPDLTEATDRLRGLEQSYATMPRRKRLASILATANQLDVYYGEFGVRLLLTGESRESADMLWSAIVARHVRAIAAISILDELPRTHLGRTHARELTQLVLAVCFGRPGMRDMAGSLYADLKARGAIDEPYSSEGRSLVLLLTDCWRGNVSALDVEELLDQHFRYAFKRSHTDLITVDDGWYVLWPAPLVALICMRGISLSQCRISPKYGEAIRTWLAMLDASVDSMGGSALVPNVERLIRVSERIIEHPWMRTLGVDSTPAPSCRGRQPDTGSD